MENEIILPEGLSKKERKKLKREFYRDLQHKQARFLNIKKYIIITVTIIVVLAGGYWFVKEATKPKPGEFILSLGNKHIQKINDSHEPYSSIPPTSGTHVNEKAQWGISESPIPDELQIHNLEDGGVMVQYNCVSGIEQKDATISAQEQDDCKKLVDELSNLVKKYSDKVLLAPYPKLDTKIALTAWTRIDKFNGFDTDRIEKFIKAFRGIDHHQE